MQPSDPRRASRQQSHRYYFCVATSILLVAMAAARGVSAEEKQIHESRPPAFDEPFIQGYGRIGEPIQLAQPVRGKASVIAPTIAYFTGYKFDPGKCGHYELGPLDDGIKRTGKEFWLALIAPYTKVVRLSERVDNRPSVIANLHFGETIHEFSIDRGPRWKALLAIAKQIDTQLIVNGHEGNVDEMKVEVGPIRGRMTTNEAFQIAIQNDDFMVRWADGGTVVSFEPATLETVYADMSESECSMGLPELGRVTVIESRLRWDALAGTASPKILDRRQIERSGKDNLPDLLQQLPQSAFHRASGYRATGTQCAELRGVGNVKVLINGKDVFGSAADYFENCFDLNSIPLGAIERIEVTPDVVSLAHGADAIGGMINVVLAEHDEQVAEVRYQGASGGASVARGTIIAGLDTNMTRASVVLDYAKTSTLIGNERERWRDQDYRLRFGGQDYSTVFASPANVGTLDGLNLPGLSAPTAAVRSTATDRIFFAPGQQNRSSLFAWQSIVPSVQRMNVSAMGEHQLDSALIRAEFLLADRVSSFTYGPELVPGLTLGPNHPDNPFGIPVAVSAALTGLPLPQQEADSTLLRGVLQIEGTISDWSYQAYALHSSENAKLISRNSVNIAALEEALSGLNGSTISVLSDAPGRGGEDVLLPASTIRALTGGTQLAASTKGAFMELPAGNGTAHIGAQFQREVADYGNITQKLHREALGAFAIVQLPLSVAVTATIGSRIDDIEGLNRVTSNQYVLQWRPAHQMRVRAAYNDTFSAPRLLDLMFPTQSFPIVIRDPSWQQNVPVTMVTGGNEALRPTVGRSSTLGMAFTGDDTFTASIDFWRVSLRDRIAVVLPHTLLSNEDIALSGRIQRDPVTPEDIAANRRGRLRLLDIRRANFGTTEARGVDASVATAFETPIGRISPKLDITYTDEFRFSDMPSSSSPTRERAGVASELGTITAWRLRGALSFDSGAWSGNLLARWNSCYDDFDTALGKTTSRTVCPGLTLDANLSWEIGEHVQVTVGVSDLLNRSPAFSEVAGRIGYDSSQNNLIGRELFFKALARR